MGSVHEGVGKLSQSLIAGSTPDEFAVVIEARSITVVAQRHSTALLGGMLLAVPTADTAGGLARPAMSTHVTLPPAGALRGALPADADVVTSQLSTFAANLHAGEGTTPQPRLLSATTVFTLRANDGAELPLLLSEDEIELRLPSVYNQSADCSYWSVPLQQWSQVGCRAAGWGEVQGDGSGVLTCRCNHTTDFAVSLSALLPSTNFSISLLRFDDISRIRWRDFADHPRGLVTVGIILIAWIAIGVSGRDPNL